jgi:hypothetical protein
MSRARGGRPVTHATKWLARRLETNRIEPRTRRLLNKLQVELASAPLETVRALLLARYGRKELIAQQAEAYLLADPNATPSKWLLGLWNSMRRDVELLALLEERASRDDVPDWQTYSQDCTATSQPHAAPQVEAQPADAAGTAVDGQEGK